MPCKMIDPGHPDDPHGEKACAGAAVGITADGVLVCGACARGQLEEGFAVFPYPERERERIFPFAHQGDRFKFSYPAAPEFDRQLTVVRVNGLQPEDTVFFDDHTYCRQKHIGGLERI